MAMRFSRRVITSSACARPPRRQRARGSMARNPLEAARLQPAPHSAQGLLAAGGTGASNSAHAGRGGPRARALCAGGAACERTPPPAGQARRAWRRRTEQRPQPARARSGLLRRARGRARAWRAKKVPVLVRTVLSMLLPVSLSTTVDFTMVGLACRRAASGSRSAQGGASRARRALRGRGPARPGGTLLTRWVTSSSVRKFLSRNARGFQDTSTISPRHSTCARCGTPRTSARAARPGPTPARSGAGVGAHGWSLSQTACNATLCRCVTPEAGSARRPRRRPRQ
jgi:hypothetical protein